MSAVDLRRRLTACCDPLGAQHEDREDYVYDGSGICRLADASAHSLPHFASRLRID
jgi:hypothetical protein